MGVSFLILKGELFQDDRGNVVRFLEYDEVTNCFFLNLVESGIEFSQSMPDFLHQYCLGIIREVCNGQAATDLV